MERACQALAEHKCGTHSSKDTLASGANELGILCGKPMLIMEPYIAIKPPTLDGLELEDSMTLWETPLEWPHPYELAPVFFAGGNTACENSLVDLFGS